VKLKNPPLKGVGGCKAAIMSANKIIHYNPSLKEKARILRKNSTLSEIIFWKNIKNKSLGYEFHRQVPLDEFIVDFYCHELNLAVEIDGNTHDYNFEKDEARQKKLEGQGIFFIRFSDNDVKRNFNDVLRAIEITILDMEKKKAENK
jgi:very-short-patch-repair endonuclease